MAVTRTKRTPKYRRHEPTGRALVEIDGRRFYLGQYGSPESRENYDRLIAEWLGAGCALPVAPEHMSVMELCELFLRHAEAHYRGADGNTTTELANVKRSVKELRTLYGRTLYGRTFVTEFSPQKLKAVRAKFIEGMPDKKGNVRKASRSTLNRYVAAVKRCFKWGCSEGYVPFEIVGVLASIEGLRKGRSEAREPKIVRPVAIEHVEAIKPFVSRQVWALIQWQLATGARGGELLKLRPIDFNRASDVWTVEVSEHKTAHHGCARTLYFGPRAQAILWEFIRDRPLHEPLFSPREATEQRAVEDWGRRENQLDNRRKTDRRVGNHYRGDTYREAIQRACFKAEVPVWSPHQLRHAAATRFREEYGLEAASILLGHRDVSTSMIYAERNQARAVEAAKALG